MVNTAKQNPSTLFTMKALNDLTNLLTGDGDKHLHFGELTAEFDIQYLKIAGNISLWNVI